MEMEEEENGGGGFRKNGSLKVFFIRKRVREEVCRCVDSGPNLSSSRKRGARTSLRLLVIIIARERQTRNSWNYVGSEECVHAVVAFYSVPPSPEYTYCCHYFSGKREVFFAHGRLVNRRGRRE